VLTDEVSIVADIAMKVGAKKEEIVRDQNKGLNEL